MIKLNKLFQALAVLAVLTVVSPVFGEEVENHPVWRVKAHGNVVMSVAFSPDGKYILSAGEDRIIKLWETATGQLVRTFSGHSKMVTSVVFSPDGKNVLSASWDRSVRLWDVETGREVKSFKGHTAIVTSVAFSPDGRHVLSASSDTTIKLWDMGSGKEMRTLAGHQGPVVAAIFTPDGKQVVSAGNDKWGLVSLRLWDLETGRNAFTREMKGTRIVTMALLPEGKRVLHDYTRTRIDCLDLGTGKSRRVISHQKGVNAIAASLDGKLAISGDITGLVKVFDVSTGKTIKDYRKDSIEIWSIAYSPDGRYVLSGGRDGTLNLWSAT